MIAPSRTGKHAAQWISSLENHVPPAIWHKAVADISPPELLAALNGIRPHERARNLKLERLPETVQRIRQRLDAVFEDAIFHGKSSSNPAAAIRRKLRESLPRERGGQFAALPYQDAPALIARLRDVSGVAARCLEFAVLTGARTSEALFAQWGEFDLEASIWTVPASRMKANEAHTVYVSDEAVALVRAMRGLDKSYVFPSPQLTGKPMSNMALLAVLGRMRVRDKTTVHGLCRATFSTWANETGAARPDVIEAA